MCVVNFLLQEVANITLNCMHNNNNINRRMSTILMVSLEEELHSKEAW